jgi:hypothetical protein
MPWSVPFVEANFKKNGLRKERKMTTIIFGILGLLGGLALAVCLGLVLYKDKSEDPVAHSKGLIFGVEN